MQAGWKILLVVSVAVLGACQKDEPEQNIVITDIVPANADVEALPADESSITPTDELVNGDGGELVNEVSADANR